MPDSSPIDVLMDGCTYTQNVLNKPGVSSLFEAFYDNASDENRYTSFKIKKRNGGFRTIDRPCHFLLKIQSVLAKEFSRTYEPTSVAHGYIRRRGILSNATPHVEKPFILNLDIRDFFGSIDDRMVERALNNLPADITGECISIIVDLVTYKNRLPQGSPTSPILSNLVCRDLDKDLARYGSDNLFEITRYGDDITISPKLRSNSKHTDLFSYDRGRIVVSPELEQIFNQYGFELNSRKTKASFQALGQRQVVTGLIVNSFPNVFRGYIRRTQSMLYSWEKWGLEAAADHHNRFYQKSPNFVSVLVGRISYVTSIRGPEDRIVCKLWTRLRAMFERDGVAYRRKTKRIPNRLPS